MKADFEQRNLLKTTSLGFSRTEFANSVVCQLLPTSYQFTRNTDSHTHRPWGHRGSDGSWAPRVGAGWGSGLRPAPPPSQSLVPGP